MQLTYRGVRYQSTNFLPTTTNQIAVKYQAHQYQTNDCAEVVVKSATPLKYFTYRGIAYMNSLSFVSPYFKDKDTDYI